MAGSGKSYLGYMSFLPYIDDPKFRGMIVRRTTPMLTKPGAVWDTASGMYKDVCPKVRTLQKSLKFVFPSGAEVQLGHMEYEQDKYSYQGSQLGLCLCDEIQQFEESQIVYLFSRLRTEANMRPRFLGTCNPEYDSFLRKWLQDAGYLDVNNFGIPFEHMSGVVKYFIRQGNDMIWRDTEEELLEEFGEDCGPMSFCFISATCRDNPILLKRDPTYLSKLKNLPRIERMRLLEGAWLVREQAAGYFKREWVPVVNHHELPDFSRLVRAYDLAGSVPSEKYPDPDWTVGVLMGVDHSGNVYVLDMVRYRMRSAKVLENIIEQAKLDAEKWGDVLIVIPEDAGAAGKTACENMIGAINNAGFIVKKNKMSNVKGRKLKAYQPFAIAAENGMVYCLHDDWNDSWYSEQEVFDPSVRGGHDDIVDATADAFNNVIDSTYAVAVPLPTINAPTMIHGLSSLSPF